MRPGVLGPCPPPTHTIRLATDVFRYKNCPYATIENGSRSQYSPRTVRKPQVRIAAAEHVEHVVDERVVLGDGAMLESLKGRPLTEGDYLAVD